jgi:hypothetical protein
MSIRAHIHVALGLAASLSACNYKDDPNFCPDRPHNNCMNTDPPACSSDRDCSGDTPACDVLGTMTCVQCTADNHSTCAGATPACIENACRPCTEHGQCDSRVCLSDDGGTCAAPEDVAYVAETGTDNDSCSQSTPCTTISKALDTGRPYLKLAGTLVEAVAIDGQNVTLLAERGTRLTSTQSGPILLIKGTSQVRIFDLEISGSQGGSGIFIPHDASGSRGVSRATISNNDLRGITSNGPGSLTVSRSTISGNRGGGLIVTHNDTTFHITNNFIIYNGRATGSDYGGVMIASNTLGSELGRNTIAFNQSNGTFRGGVSCTGSRVTATANLIFHNSEPGVTGPKTDIATQMNSTGGCQYGSSLAIADDAGNPGFKSPRVAPYDFHLTASSPATIVDAAGACTGVDFDGDERPLGAACDLGADELRK